MVIIGTLLSGIFPGLLIYSILWLFIPQEPLASKSIDVDFEVVEEK
jgi:phage shock protein PspC (stress-responsive transcriptional regulator)